MVEKNNRKKVEETLVNLVDIKDRFFYNGYLITSFIDADGEETATITDKHGEYIDTFYDVESAKDYIDDNLVSKNKKFKADFKNGQSVICIAIDEAEVRDKLKVIESDPSFGNIIRVSEV